MSRIQVSPVLDRATWRKSRRSASNTHCVEVAVTSVVVGVRDTKDRTGGTLSFSRSQWADFVSSLRHNA